MWITAGVLAVGAAALVASLAVLPPLVREWSGTVADGATLFPITGPDHTTASVQVPADWFVIREADGSATVRTPDARLSVHLSVVDLTSETSASSVAPDTQLITIVDQCTGPLRSEILASGATVQHCRTDDAVLALVRVEPSDARSGASSAPAESENPGGSGGGAESEKPAESENPGGSENSGGSGDGAESVSSPAIFVLVRADLDPGSEYLPALALLLESVR